jgi:7-cyano-7-deazaguanine reductase
MPDSKILETFPNPHPTRDYLIEHVAGEFTSICPKTGQPDFAAITLRYVPAATCVELKSLKFYLQSFRTEGIYYEDVTNVILDALVSCTEPKWMQIKSTWSTRGGIQSIITTQHGTCPLPNCDQA